MRIKSRSTLAFFITFIALSTFALIKILPSGGDIKENNQNQGTRGQKVPAKFYILFPEKITQKIYAVGTIIPNEEVEIRSEISGKITGIFFREGDKTEKDKLLLQINDDELQAQLKSAESRQKLAELYEERQKLLSDKKLVSQEEYDKSASELNVVRAEVQLIRARLAKAEIRSPFDGVIGLRYVSEGSYISPSTLITTFQDINTVKVDFTIPEKYSGEIKTGDKIGFTVQGSPRIFTGTVYAVSPKIDLETRTLRIRASCPNNGGFLLPGRFANVEVRLREKENLMVPSYAVIPEMKRHKVFIYKDGKAEERIVEIGARTDERIEIIKGVNPGDTLITSAVLLLRSGMPVKLLH